MDHGFARVKSLQVYANGSAFQLRPGREPPLVVADLSVPERHQEERAGVFEFEEAEIVGLHFGDEGEEFYDAGGVARDVGDCGENV